MTTKFMTELLARLEAWLHENRPDYFEKFLPPVATDALLRRRLLSARFQGGGHFLGQNATGISAID